ncbi:unnamed protein product [Adineta steineri]|uniref:Uncharacterized protein n=1 Tax=Adineta steineri TaxID=433720 RepID=A0A813NJY7_9BILA|nr:unnamed protein product [Adineta steineri]
MGPLQQQSSMVWKKHGLLFNPSVTSVTLSMISHVKGGKGNSIAIDDIQLRVCSTTYSGVCPTDKTTTSTTRKRTTSTTTTLSTTTSSSTTTTPSTTPSTTSSSLITTIPATKTSSSSTPPSTTLSSTSSSTTTSSTTTTSTAPSTVSTKSYTLAIIDVIVLIEICFCVVFQLICLGIEM